METLEIKKENAIAAHNEAGPKTKKVLEHLFGKKTFLKSIVERIKSFEDVCEEMGKDPKDYVYIGNDPIERILNALKKWILVAECFNEGKEPDWSNSNQPKFFPWLKYTAGSGWSLSDVAAWYTYTRCGSRQTFLNRDHVNHVYKYMPEIFIDFIKH